MMKIILFLFFVTICNIKAVNTEGKLRFNNVEVLTVGEVFEAELILIPFEESLIKVDTFEGKNFLGLFYVSEVISIQTSENNYDATVVKMNMILPKAFSPQSVYIWQLGDRNIPVQLEKKAMNNVNLNTKDFILFSLPDVDFSKKFNWYYLAIGILLLVIVVTILLKRKNKQKNVNSDLDGCENLFLNIKSHKDLEEVFLKRKWVYQTLKRKESKEKLASFLEMYEYEQFRPSWRKMDISPILKEAKNFENIFIEEKKGGQNGV